MKANEEIDALATMGISRTQRLVLPKIAALTTALPLLVLWTSAAGILGAHAGIIGCIQAMEALKYLAGIPSPLVGAMLSADTRRMRFTTIPLAPNPACRCRTNAGCGAAMKN